jgi:hypothetical protein
MLTLERAARTRAVNIRLQGKSPLFDRTLTLALLCSILVHLVLFGIFRIKMTDIGEPLALLDPIEVALVTEKLDKEQELPLTEVVSENEALAPKARITDLVRACNHIPLPTVTFRPAQEIYVPERDVDHSNGYQQASQLTEQVLKTHIQKFPCQLHVYPLTLQLSPSLKKLTLMEDGMQFFIPKQPGFSSGYFMTQTPIPIEYQVKIDGASGKITSWQRHGQLIDKVLQSCADLIIKAIRFAPTEAKMIEGKIAIIFACNGDSLQEWLTLPLDVQHKVQRRRT